MLSFSGVTFNFVVVSFSSFFVFIKAEALPSIVPRNAFAPAATRSYQASNDCLCPLFVFVFCFLGGVAFSWYSVVSSSFPLLYGEYVVSFLPDGVSLPSDHGLEYDIMCVCVCVCVYLLNCT